MSAEAEFEAHPQEAQRRYGSGAFRPPGTGTRRRHGNGRNSANGSRRPSTADSVGYSTNRASQSQPFLIMAVDRPLTANDGSHPNHSPGLSEPRVWEPHPDGPWRTSVSPRLNSGDASPQSQSQSGVGVFQVMSEEERVGLELEEVTFIDFKCAICLETFCKTNRLNCGHKFCKFCIIEWKRKRPHSQVCPVCRDPIVLMVPQPAVDTEVSERYLTLPEEVQNRRRRFVSEREAAELLQTEAMRHGNDPEEEIGGFEDAIWRAYSHRRHPPIGISSTGRRFAGPVPRFPNPAFVSGYADDELRRARTARVQTQRFAEEQSFGSDQPRAPNLPTGHGTQTGHATPDPVLPAPPTHYASRYPSSTPARGADSWNSPPARNEQPPRPGTPQPTMYEYPCPPPRNIHQTRHPHPQPPPPHPSPDGQMQMNAPPMGYTAPGFNASFLAPFLAQILPAAAQIIGFSLPVPQQQQPFPVQEYSMNPMPPYHGGEVPTAAHDPNFNPPRMTYADALASSLPQGSSGRSQNQNIGGENAGPRPPSRPFPFVNTIAASSPYGFAGSIQLNHHDSAPSHINYWFNSNSNVHSSQLSPPEVQVHTMPEQPNASVVVLRFTISR